MSNRFQLEGVCLLGTPFSPSETYYPLLNEMSNTQIVPREITNPPSTTVVESRFTSDPSSLLLSAPYRCRFHLLLLLVLDVGDTRYLTISPRQVAQTAD